MKLRVGIVGCGLITQVMHLHYLKELDDRFEVTALCDVSPSTLEQVGNRYGIAARYTDWREMLQTDIDLLMVLTPGTHAPITIAAAEAGKHVFVEKPMCFTLREADEILAAVDKAGVVLMVGNMKRYDPGYIYGLNEIKQMKNIIYARVTTLEAPIAPYVKQLPLFLGAQDTPPEVRASSIRDSERLCKEALGDADERDMRVYQSVLLDNLVHEVNALRGILGEPEKVLFADFWKDGEGFTSVLRFPKEIECTLSWANLPELPSYSQELSFYSPEKRVSINFPSPFLRNEPTPVHLEEMNGGALRKQVVTVSREEAFKQELLHLYDCIVEGTTPLTDGLSAKRDLAVLLAMYKSWKSGKPEEIPVF